MLRIGLIGAVAVVVGAACGTPMVQPCIGVDGGACASNGGGSATGGGTPSNGGGSATGGGFGGGGGGAVVHAATACPHVDLGSATSISYSGDTTGLPNWVASQRLEWTDAPDDTLAFTAPSAGQYTFALTDSTTTNQGMGVSLRDFSDTFYSACPASPTGTMIDGIFERAMSSAETLTAGQQLLIYVSATSWSVPATFGKYTLTITKQ